MIRMSDGNKKQILLIKNYRNFKYSRHLEIRETGKCLNREFQVAKVLGLKR